MTSLGEELITHKDTIVQRWYERWRRSATPHAEVDEAALKDSLADQLELIGEQLRELDTAEDPEKLWTIWERLSPEKRVDQDIPIAEVVQEYRFAVDGVRRWLDERGIDVSFAEYSYFYQAMFELTAESVKRYARREAELVTKGRAEYLAGVMHQLRTPLSALSVTIDTIGRGDGHVSTATAARLQRNLRRIRLLVDGVLRVERYRPEDTPIRPELVHPARLVDEILGDYEHDAMRKGLRYEAHVNRTLQMSLDPDLFTDALGNLVQNAVKVTSSGFVIVEADENDGAVVFRVKDSGPGIPDDRRAALFREPQAGSGGGAGLGLVIARHAACALGGEIGVDSEVGEGSAFWLKLPRAVPAGGAA